MTDFNKIIELLDKDEISSEERDLLDSLISRDPEAKKISRAYMFLKSSLKNNGHIDEELMGEYILFKNNLSSGKFIVLLSGMIEDHIRKCSACESLFKDLNTEYSATDEFIGENIIESTRGKVSEVMKDSLWSRFNKFGYAVASAAALMVIYAGLFVVSSIITPDYKEHLGAGEEFYTTRGRTSELFQRGLDAIDRKDYSSAVGYLNEDVSNNSDDESIFYTHFILGITYLNKAESDFLGLFRSYSGDDVRRGIENLQKSISLNKSGRFDNLKLDSHYFLGKSYLMLDNTARAKEHLQKVVEGRGSYYRKAEELLKLL